MRQCRHGFGAPRVLVVEDEGLIASVAAEVLIEEGYDVRTAGDGRLVLLPTSTPIVRRRRRAKGCR